MKQKLYETLVQWTVCLFVGLAYFGALHGLTYVA